MGLSVNPDQTFAYTPGDQRYRPEAERPTLRFRYLTAREVARVESLFDESRKGDTVAAQTAKVVEAVRVALVGWANYPVPYDPNELDAVLTWADLIELRDSLTHAMTLDQLEKKHSALRSPSTGGNSAAPTATASA